MDLLVIHYGVLCIGRYGVWCPDLDLLVMHLLYTFFVLLSLGEEEKTWSKYQGIEPEFKSGKYRYTMNLIAAFKSKKSA